MYKRLIISKLAFCFLLISCVNDNDYELPDFEQITKKSDFDGEIISFSDLLTSATASVTQHLENQAVEGFVVSSDEAGNFFKKLYLQNAEKTHGIIISVNKSSLYTDFPIGAKVQIRLKNLSKQQLVSGLELGYQEVTSNNGRVSVGAIPQVMTSSTIIRKNEPIITTPLLAKTATETSVLKSQLFENQLVTIENVSFDTADVGKELHQAQNDAQSGTSYKIIDAKGNFISLRTSKYANFSTEKIPAGILKITAVVTKFGTSYQLMLNDFSDILAVGSGQHSVTPQVPEIEAVTATADDYVNGKKVILKGSITFKNNKSYIAFSDGTLVEIYAPADVFKTLSSQTKTKLKRNGQSISITGKFTDYKQKNGTIIKEIVYEKESDLVFY